MKFAVISQFAQIFVLAAVVGSVSAATEAAEASGHSAMKVSQASIEESTSQSDARLLAFADSLSSNLSQAPEPGGIVELPVDVVRDKIRGGLLGQILGNLNGLKHEFEYIAEPGNVTEYTPALPNGAFTDDDTDIEWVYVLAMQQRGVTLIPAPEIQALWQAHINRRIWSANQYARQLMDLGMTPPLTGDILFNPFADFNIAGQFVGDMWGLLAPGMPQTAARIGVNYTRATVCGEPLQTTQMIGAMIATAFLTDNVERILDAGTAALDPASVIRKIIADVRSWHRQYPDDWRTVRRLIKEKYSRFGGALRDRNGFELNTASIVAALLYGQGDFIKTAIAAFNFGWDADCNAATALTVIGVTKGARWMQAQGWNIKDVYANQRRDNMPLDETITSFGDRLIALAERVIAEQGGEKTVKDGKAVFRIRTEPAANIEPLPDPASKAVLVEKMKDEIEELLLRGQNPQDRARATYQAICLGIGETLRTKHPDSWNKGLEALAGYPKVIGVLFFESDIPTGEQLRNYARRAGLKDPAERIIIWTDPKRTTIE
ncbi:MAG TPA: ADP-ribosylglycohydrolase family protein [Acidobacteriota bacterium]|nr:ADP-ribosylglycohydrolase family protein [Acidobacteriota bacterium]